MGDGDVRFWSQKTTQPGSDDHPLPDAPDGKGSFWTDGQAVTAIDEHLARVSAAVEKLESARGSEANAYRIMVCGLIHTQTRTLLETEGPFDMDVLIRRCDEVAELCEAFAGLRAE
jgi:hypothetical protein